MQKNAAVSLRNFCISKPFEQILEGVYFLLLLFIFINCVHII